MSAEAVVLSLEKGAFSQAIRELEELSDAGRVHPDLSYDRALAYLLRATSPQAQPGDLGQAIAGLREAVLSNPEDIEARVALEAVEKEALRRQALKGQEAVGMAPSLSREVVGLLPEQAWASLTLVAVALITLSLALVGRSLPALVARGAKAALIFGACLLAVSGSGAFFARHLRVSSAPAVVVSSGAKLLRAPEAAQDAGAKSPTIPEGALVHVRRREGGLAEVEWGSQRAWVASHELRLLRYR